MLSSCTAAANENAARKNFSNSLAAKVQENGVKDTGKGEGDFAVGSIIKGTAAVFPLGSFKTAENSLAFFAITKAIEELIPADYAPSGNPLSATQRAATL